MEITKAFERRCKSIEKLLQNKSIELAIEQMFTLSKSIFGALDEGIIDYSQTSRLHDRLLRCLAFYQLRGKN